MGNMLTENVEKPLSVPSRASPISPKKLIEQSTFPVMWAWHIGRNWVALRKVKTHQIKAGCGFVCIG